MSERLTSNKKVSDMGMYRLALNSCYCKDGKARYRDFDTDIDAREFVRNLMVRYGIWKPKEAAGQDADDELYDDDSFDDAMIENLMHDMNEPTGLIALFYRNLWAMAELYEELKQYEDMEEQGLLLKLPCAIGDTVYEVYNLCEDGTWEIDEHKILLEDLEKIGETIFVTREEAETALEKVKGKNG